MEQIVFDPLLIWPIIFGLAGLSICFLSLSLWRGLPGWWLRACALGALLLALANPSWQQEERSLLPDIAIAVVDDSASQRLSDRPEQTAAALAHIQTEIENLPNTQLRIIRVGDGADNTGTALMSALREGLAQEPAARLAGVFMISDGRVHDVEQQLDLTVPMHLFMTGHPEDWDRRLVVENAPAFAIIGEPVTLRLRLQDQGAAPMSGPVALDISVDGAPPERFNVPLGEDLELPLTLRHGGMNVVQFSTPFQDGELTAQNNAAVVQINGVRDRLRVLLVSGEPHQGARVWRNLLKSDSAVDLVHFTILRPAEKQDGVPSDELSLIAFPTHELFMEKIDDFDLIIFDRYKRRGILPQLYLENIRRYVEAGGAVLVAAGPDYANAASLHRSPLGEILPGLPSARIYEEGFVPTVTDLGARHPVTAGLDNADNPWGRWFRQIDLSATTGQVLMEGVDGAPLLLLDRVGRGRVAVLASDHAWLWGRGFEGGGPQLELLRRLAHWMMKEPELDEEALIARTAGDRLIITRRTLSQEVPPVELRAPDGTMSQVVLDQTTPGRWQAEFLAPQTGLYRLRQGDLETIMALGPSSPLEFAQTVASPAVLSPAIEATRGGVRPISEGLPRIRQTRLERPAQGRGWLGIVPRNAYVTTDIRIFTIVPAWLLMALSAGFMVFAWLREGRSAK